MSVEYNVGHLNHCGDGIDDIDLENICEQFDENEGVVIKKSTVIVVTPQSQKKRKRVEHIDESVEPPCVGMLYSTWEDLEVEYKKYGKQQGFGISRVQSVLSKDKTHRRAMTWRCECWGDPEMRLNRASKKRALAMDVGGSAVIDEGSRRKRKSKKCFCPAMVYAHVNSNGSWEIRKVILQHDNHTPNPSQSKLVKEYRMQSFHSGVRRRLLDGTDVGVPIPKIHDTMARERDGVENMPFLEKDMRHVVDQERRLKMEGGDANALMSYFEKMQRQNLKFFHAHRLAEDGTLKDVIWVDARSQAAYEEFGDVACFDSTYLTNEYDLPFANFVGVNHHVQSILLGCALISKEDCDTFNWIFSQWLLCMKGKAPRAILTDQAAAMQRPLEQIMPETRHRWCIWHILQKLPKKFAKDERYENIKEELLRAIYDSFTVGEFESSWEQVIQKFSLESSEWLSNLFDERFMWVPTFMKDYFWAGMRTTQRVESINSFFDKFIGRHTRLCEFGEKYCAAVERRVWQENDADARDEKWIRNLSTGFEIEKIFRKLYTDSKFRVVQRECERLMYCFVRKEKEEGMNKYTYLLEDRVWVLPKDCEQEVITSRRRMYCVQFDSETKDATCDCRMFETQGIVCRHLIRVFDQNYVDPIPEKYILRRWRKDVLRKHSNISVAYHDHSKTMKVKRHDKISVAMEPLYDIACAHDVTTSIVLRGIRSMLQEVKEWVKDNPNPEPEQLDGEVGANNSIEGHTVLNVNARTESSQAEFEAANNTPSSTAKKLPSNQTNQTSIKDPPIPRRGKGRTKSNRFKAIGEPGWKKANNVGKNKSGASSNPTGDTDSSCKKIQNFPSTKIGASNRKVMRKDKAVSFACQMEDRHTNEFCINDDDDLLHRNFLRFDD